MYLTQMACFPFKNHAFSALRHEKVLAITLSASMTLVMLCRGQGNETIVFLGKDDTCFTLNFKWAAGLRIHNDSMLKLENRQQTLPINLLF